MLDFKLGVSDYRYITFTKENHTDYFGEGNWRLDVSRDFNIAGGFSAARLHEARGSSDSPASADEPTPYNKYDASISFNKQFNRLSVQLGGAVQHLDYQDVDAVGGGTIDQDLRDGTIYTGVLKKSYEFSPGYRVFGLIEGNKRLFKGSATTTDRDSKGIEGRTGVEFEISRVMAGEFSLGYLYQDYESASFKDVRGLAAKGALLWNPTQLMTITLNGERRVSETSYSTASSHLDTIVSAQLDYEIMRNLIGSPFVSYTLEDYQGVSREDRTVNTGLSLDYFINRNFSVGATYTFVKKDSNIDTIDYDKNQVGGWVKLQF
jgi:hypothetical protein